MSEVNDSFELAWACVTRRLAVAAGASVALAALLFDVPVRIAVLRGGATTVGLLLVVRYGLRFLNRLASNGGEHPGASSRPAVSTVENDAN